MQGLGNLKTIELHAPASAYYEPGQKFVGIAIEDVPMGTGIAEKILDVLDKVHAEYRDAWAADMQRSALAEARAAEDAASPAEEEVAEAEASEDTADLLRAQPVIPPSSVPSRDTQEDAALESAGENEPEDNAEEEPQELEPAISDERPHHSGKDK